MGKLATSAVCLLSVLCAATADAGRWQVTKNIGLGTDYTGNVFLEPEDGAREKELVLSLLPRISASRSGARASANISYAPQLRYFTQGTQSNDIVHFLNASGDVEVIERRLGIRANARAGQRIIDRNQGFAGDSITNPDNITNTYSFSIAPYLLPIRFGRYATLSVDTGIQYVANQDAVNSDVGDISFSLVSGPKFQRFNWSLASSYRTTRFDDDTSSSFGAVSVGLGYRIDREWRVNATLIQDNNDVDTTRDINGLGWDLGFDWTPSQRTSLSFGLGRRYNSENYRLNFQHRHKKTTWSASYQRTLQTSNDDFLNRILFPTTDPDGNPIVDPSLDPDANTILPGPNIDSTVFIADNFNLQMNWRYRRTTFGFNTGYTRRDNLQAADVSSDLILGFNIGRTMTQRSSGNVTVTLLQHSDQDSANNDYDQWVGNLGYSYSLSQHWSLSMSYQLTFRKTVDAAEDFQEDRISVNLISNYQ